MAEPNSAAWNRAGSSRSQKASIWVLREPTKLQQQRRCDVTRIAGCPPQNTGFITGIAEPREHSQEVQRVGISALGELL